ncbi:MAG: FtsX-like permease family protein [Thermodesulfobacteriota bacterium]|nr:FtsX-like permease family protein [Thermodesulfobacteriota bacterium]
MSIDVKMAWRNIWRNPRRTVLTIAAIAFACLLLVFMLSFQFGSYETMINSSVKIHTGHLQVQSMGYHEKKSIRLVVPDPDAVAKILDQIQSVEAYTHRANAFSLVSSKKRTYGGIVSGIDPDKEAKVSTLKSLIRKGRYLSKDDTDQVLLGHLLAENLKIDIQDEVTLLGQGLDGSVAATVAKVKGIYSSGIDDLDRSSIHMPLKYFQDVYGMHGAVHEVIVTANSLKTVDEIKSFVNKEINKISPKSPLVVLDWKELTPGLVQSIQLDLVSGIIFYFLLILVVAFSILNTFLMVIFERTREFGVLKAIGITPGRLTKLLLLESMSMTMIGIMAGIFGGCLITLYFQGHGIDISGASDILVQYGISGRIFPRLSLLSALSGPAIVFMITFLAALYPAFKIRSLRPVEAMTHV